MHYNENNYDFSPHEHVNPYRGRGRGNKRFSSWERAIVIEEAIRIAREQVPGEVIQAELKQRGERKYYEIEIINELGVEYEVKIDYYTAQVLEVKLD